MNKPRRYIGMFNSWFWLACCSSYDSCSTTSSSSDWMDSSKSTSYVVSDGISNVCSEAPLIVWSSSDYAERNICSVSSWSFCSTASSGSAYLTPFEKLLRVLRYIFSSSGEYLTICFRFVCFGYISGSIISSGYLSGSIISSGYISGSLISSLSIVL